MSKKSFQNMPKPQRLTSDVVESFERSGLGHAPVRSDEPSQMTKNEPKKRISVDVPESLHRRFKTACSATSRQMVSELRHLIEARILELEREVGDKGLGGAR